MPDQSAPLPTFLIIGAQKSATRWLRQNLAKHPEVLAAPFEVAFFNGRSYQALGSDWYRRQFEGWAGEPIVGEATPGYMMWRHGPARVAGRIRETVPGVRLLAVLRNPVDRANSAMVHHIRRQRIRPDAKLLDLVRRQPPQDDRYGLITGGWYAASLRPYQREFGDQLLVLLHEDVRRDPAGVYARALADIGASPGFVPPDLHEVVLSNQPPDAKRRYDLTPEERVELFGYFRDDIRRLARMFDLDLSAWCPEGEPSAGGPDTRLLLEAYDESVCWTDRVVETAVARREDPAVRARLDSLLATALYFSVVVARAEMGDPRTAEERARFASDPVAGFRDAAARLRAALLVPGALEGTVEPPSGRMPSASFAWFALIRLAAGAWDLAESTGWHTTVPPGLGSRIVEAARSIIGVSYVLDGTASGGGAAGELVERFLATLGTTVEARP